MLLRFYDSISGRVLLDGHDIKTLNINWLRSIIGLVQQEPILFNSTITENIAYGMDDGRITADDVQKAAKQANIHDEILRFPEVNLCLSLVLFMPNHSLNATQKLRPSVFWRY